MLQIILTLIFYVWLFGVLALLWLNYRGLMRATNKLIDLLEKRQP